MDVPAPPVDPRSSWALPPPGGMATTTDLDATTTRVRAANPSPMPLDGTNTYVVGAPGAGEVAVVDPGPELDDHLARVEEVVARRDAVAGAPAVPPAPAPPPAPAAPRRGPARRTGHVGPGTGDDL
jgi:hypothetical protein